MKKQNSIYLTIGIVAIIILGIFLVTNNSNSVTNEKISMRLPVPVIDGLFSQYFIGIDEGFYEEQKLEVTFQPGSQETNPVKMVGMGVDEFGLAGGPELVLMGRSRNLPIVAVAVIQKDSDFTQIISLEESEIKTIKDLEGKKVGFNYGHISTDIIRYLLKKENVSVIEVDVGYDYTQLIAGKIDAQWAFRAYAPVNLEAKGIKLNIIDPADYGVSTDGLTIFTTEEIINENPELVERFLRGVFKGTSFALNDSQKSLQSIMSRYPDLNPELELQRINIILEFTSNSEEYPIGYLDYEMFRKAYDRLNEQGLLESEFDINNAFTTKFINKINSD